MVISKVFDWCEEYNIEKVIVDISNDDTYITIYNSSKIKKTSHMIEVLDWLKGINLTNKILNRSNFLLLAEWKSHNILYNINFKRLRTEHVDFNTSVTIFGMLIYIFLSFFYIEK